MNTQNSRTYTAIYNSAIAEFTAAQKAASDEIRNIASDTDRVAVREACYVAYDAVKEEYEAAQKSYKAAYDVDLAAIKTKYDAKLAASKKKYDVDLATIDAAM